MPSNGTNGHGVALEFEGKVYTPSPVAIHSFADIPDILSMEIPPIDYLVDGMISRGSMTLWAGADGVAKTFLAHCMAVAVASGGRFLGRRCQKAPVLLLDYENPSHAIRDRMELLTGGMPVPNLKVWGTWLEQQPPQIGSELLLTIAREIQPLMIFDPMRYAHGAEENDSTEMMGVMQQLRYCAARGAAVVVLHHVGKAENSNGRGSTAIRGAVDVAFIQSMDAESGLISLVVDKNRFAEAHHTITVRPNFDEGTFEVTDSPQFTRHNQELEALQKIISQNPGLSTNSICDKSGMMRAKVRKLLKEHTGRLWEVQEQGRSRLYFAMGLSTQTHLETHRPTGGFGGHGSMGLSPLGETHQTQTHHPRAVSGSEDRGSLVCPGCGLQGDWSTHLGLAKHMSVCKPEVH